MGNIHAKSGRIKKNVGIIWEILTLFIQINNLKFRHINYTYLIGENNMEYIRAWREYKRQLFAINPDLIDVSVYFVIMLVAYFFHAPVVGVGIVVGLMIYDVYLSYTEGKKLVEGK